MKDSHLSKLHSSVPRSMRQSLRSYSLNGYLLFLEETVAIAAANLKGDFQLQMKYKALQRLQDPGNNWDRGKKAIFRTTVGLDSNA